MDVSARGRQPAGRQRAKGGGWLAVDLAKGWAIAGNRWSPELPDGWQSACRGGDRPAGRPSEVEP
jgi:hypothetical protein